MTGRILVVEGDKHVLDTVADVLSSEGHGVIGLRHPAPVLEVVARERPDLILVDMMLPTQSGIDVAHRLAEGRGDVLRPAARGSARPLRHRPAMVT